MVRRSLVFTGPESVDLRVSPLDHGDDELVVESRVSAISAGTELLIYNGEAPTDLPAGATLDAIEGDLSYPVRYGYATVGDVIETGSAVEEDWTGRTVLALNPHETQFAASPADLFEVPDGLEPDEMALFPTVETATSFLLDGRPRIGERVVVFGAGVVGLCTIGLLSSFPLSELVVIDPLAERRERALDMGADSVHGSNAIPADRWLDAAGPDGADLIYELSGQPAALDEAVSLAGYDSRVVVGSWYGTKPTTLYLGDDFHRDRVSIESSQVSTLDPEVRGRWTLDRRTEVVLEKLTSLPVESLVTHRIPFDKAPEAYRLLDDHPDEALQVLLTYP
jgi:2-desacetyl-2-hydroxyethyl bacteriochlorophyllide A dehydrogenase